MVFFLAKWILGTTNAGPEVAILLPDRDELEQKQDRGRGVHRVGRGEIYRTPAGDRFDGPLGASEAAARFP